MAIDRKTRAALEKILKGIDYRKIISERTGCHPNTVTNVLKGNDNNTVELQLLILAKETKEERDRIEKEKAAYREAIIGGS